MPVKMKKPFKKTVHKIKTASARMTAVKSKLEDMDVPIDDNTYLHLEGCEVFTNMHKGTSYVKNCHSITFKTKKPNPEPVIHNNPNVQFEQEE
jgi:hypothetical protein